MNHITKSTRSTLLPHLFRRSSSAFTHCRRSLLVLAAAIACAAPQAVSAAQPDPESPAAKEARLAWFREAKFGLFIHWGLNVGPDATGVIPQPSQDNLRTVGEWLKLNGEAVYGAGPTPFGEELGEYSATAKGIDGKPLFQPRNDWRCTVKPGKLHFTLFRIGWDGFWIPPFKNRIKSVTHINETGQRVPLTVETLPDGRRRVMISLLSVRDTMGAVVVVEIEGEEVER